MPAEHADVLVAPRAAWLAGDGDDVVVVTVRGGRRHRTNHLFTYMTDEDDMNGWI